MLHELLYTSAARNPMSTEDLMALLKHAREKNARLQITGLLVYHNGEFMQLIEGEKEIVQSLWKTIRLDDRHIAARIVYDGPIKERGFAEWTMGFRDLGDADPKELEGFSGFLDNGFTSEVVAENPSLARKLMVSIKGFLFDR